MTIKLDIGCGASANKGYIGVDIDPRFKAIHSKADALPWQDGEADEVYSSHLLEHTLEPLAMLQEWHRVLRAGGRLVVRVPNLMAWVERWLMTEGQTRWEYPLVELVFGWVAEGPMRHRTGFDVERLRAMVEAAGFEVESCEAVRSRHSHGPEYHPQGDILCEAVKRGA